MLHAFHEGERAVQERAGGASIASRVAGSIHVEVPPAARGFLLEQPFAALASRTPDGRVWASLVHGAPGFLSVPSDWVIEIDAKPVAGDPLAASLAPGAPVGALVIDLATRRRMRANGRVERPGMPIRVTVDEVFANCPKYIQRRTLVADDALDARPAIVSLTDALTSAQRERIARADTFITRRATPSVASTPRIAAVHPASSRCSTSGASRGPTTRATRCSRRSATSRAIRAPVSFSPTSRAATSCS